MIEVIYDKNKDNSDDTTKSTEKENALSIGLKLPKNIRQIGTPASNKRIYIEDYVVTYLNYISCPGSTCARGAILLGECKKSDLGDVIFISGAVDAENLEFDMDESEFTQEAWTNIYEQVKEFFPDLTVVGWFLSRMGFSTAINEKIEKMHVENFPGKDKVLYVTDSLENEDAFYMYEKGQLVRQKGYYIYYSKNEAMQNYIVKKKADLPKEKDTEIHRKDEALIKSFRERNPIKRNIPQKQGISLAYVAGSFLVLGLLVMGVTVINNADRMRELEVSLNRLQLTAEANNDDIADAMANINQNDGPASPADVVAPSTENTSHLQNANVSELTTSVDNATTESSESENEKTTTESVTTQEETTVSTEQTLPVITDGNPTYYVVCDGDSLSSIAEYFYGSVIYALDIAEANNIGLDDKIYVGQSIIIPSISER